MKDLIIQNKDMDVDQDNKIWEIKYGKCNTERKKYKKRLSEAKFKYSARSIRKDEKYAKLEKKVDSLQKELNMVCFFDD